MPHYNGGDKKSTQASKPHTKNMSPLFCILSQTFMSKEGDLETTKNNQREIRVGGGGVCGCQEYGVLF